jgi:hypothetical protein
LLYFDGMEEDKPVSSLQMIRVFKNLNFTFLQKGNALIYIAMSRVGDSVSFLKK